jgi:hypothetical protein
VRSPNGSTIIIYGHDLGLRILWRGGRSFRLPQEQQQSAEGGKPAPNGTGKNEDVIMIIDSDDEDPTPAIPEKEVESAQFEDEEDEVDPTRPFQRFLRYIDIPLDIKILGVAVPNILPETARSSLDPFPPIISEAIVVTAVCFDCSVRIISLPLAPPPPAVEDSAAWGVQTRIIRGGSAQAIPAGVSLTFTCRKPSDDGRRYRSQSRSRSTDITPDSKSGDMWDLLLAVHSAEASGILSIYRVPITQQSNRSGNAYRFSTEPILPIQQQYLSSPAKTISFNPLQYPAERHSHLLVSFASGCVKVYACLAVKSQKPAADRRNPTAEAELRETEGRWIVTLYPDFEQSLSGISRRKPVVDAKWVLGGKAIIVLLSNGEWGVWDIEGAGPGNKHGISQSQNNTGSSTTSFAVTGRVVGSRSLTKTHISGPTPEQKRKFAPMTPSTRRVREDTLFKGSSRSNHPHSTRGTISVAPTTFSRDTPSDESILIWHGDKNIRISSLLSFWRNTAKSTGAFEPSNRCKPVPIEDINLLGETQNGICHLLLASPSKNEEARIIKPDILITTEHRLIILASRLSEQHGDHMSKDQTVAISSVEDDQFMLRRGELDLDGVERVLSSMASGTQQIKERRNPQGRRLFS